MRKKSQENKHYLLETCVYMITDNQRRDLDQMYDQPTLIHTELLSHAVVYVQVSRELTK